MRVVGPQAQRVCVCDNSSSNIDASFMFCSTHGIVVGGDGSSNCFHGRWPHLLFEAFCQAPLALSLARSACVRGTCVARMRSRSRKIGWLVFALCWGLGGVSFGTFSLTLLHRALKHHCKLILACCSLFQRALLQRLRSLSSQRALKHRCKHVDQVEPKN